MRNYLSETLTKIRPSETTKKRIKIAGACFSVLTGIVIFAALMTWSAYSPVEKQELLANFNKQKKCVTFAKFWEGKRADITDQIGVAQVVFNLRVSGKLSETNCSVVNKVKKDKNTGKMVAIFSSTQDHRPDPETELADNPDSIVSGMVSRVLVIDDALNGPNFTKFIAVRERFRHATHFHAHYVKPDWSVKDVEECKLAYITSTAGHKYYGPAWKVNPAAYRACKARLTVEAKAKTKAPAKVEAKKASTPVRLAAR